MNPTEPKTPVQLKLVEDSFNQIQQLVHAQMKGAALKMVKSLFDEEVERVCGRPFSHKGTELAHRAGSDPGSVLLNGQRVKIKKPRIKSKGVEVPLESYQALNDYDLLCERTMKFMLSGVSTRNYDPLLDELSGGLGLKKSSVSKAFVKGSREDLDFINGRDLKTEDIFCIMIDGVYVAGRAVIAALGINSKGKKIILGLREGNTEDSDIVKDLLQSFIERGLSKDSQILFVIDGAKALKSGIRKCFGHHHLIQRCIIHKERNIKKYLPEQYHAEFKRRWRLIHGLVEYEEAIIEYKKLFNWLSSINHEAAKSLDEAELETLTVVKIKAPALLRKTLCSTNPIESVFSSARRMMKRVKNWKGVDQVSRWSASTLRESEKKFRTIRGFKEIELVKINMKNLNLDSKTGVA
jgi:transposase-like protein